nr:type I toxin-antitoxin system Fst family toxin [Enterococcus innesii]
MVQEIVTLVVAPLFVGLVLLLVSRWLDGKDDN